jgi:Mg-chelatase subunit ChlI
MGDCSWRHVAMCQVHEHNLSIMCLCRCMCLCGAHRDVRHIVSSLRLEGGLNAKQVARAARASLGMEAAPPGQTLASDLSDVCSALDARAQHRQATARVERKLARRRRREEHEQQRRRSEERRQQQQEEEGAFQQAEDKEAEAPPQRGSKREGGPEAGAEGADAVSVGGLSCRCCRVTFCDAVRL